MYTYKAVVTPLAGLNVRSGPGTGYKVVKALKKGSTVTVYEDKNGWSRIGTNQWVCSKYIKKAYLSCLGFLIILGFDREIFPISETNRFRILLLLSEVHNIA